MMYSRPLWKRRIIRCWGSSNLEQTGKIAGEKVLQTISPVLFYLGQHRTIRTAAHQGQRASRRRKTAPHFAEDKKTTIKSSE